MSTPVTLYNLKRSDIERMRAQLGAHPSTKPGMVVGSFVTLSLRRRVYFSDCPAPGAMTPEQRNREQIKLNLEYLRLRGITPEYQE